jgi:uncharacterized protein YecE (DUF72 family)
VKNNLYIGTAGWSYEDWKGVVYPAAQEVDELFVLSQLFDTVEVNSSFYRPPTPQMTRNWLKRVEHNPRFLFTVKLFRHFTHMRDQLTPSDEIAFRQGIEPLKEAQKLGALLLQFPYSFHDTPHNRTILVDLFDRFKDYPLVLEIRHASWDKPVVLESLTRHGVGFCNVDQPALSASIQRTEHLTSKIAYLRLHGRNYVDWFRKDAGAQRYNYLYSREELMDMVPSIHKFMAEAESVFVIANNHFRGQAVANALQLKFYATGDAPSPPACLLRRYPNLQEFLTQKTSPIHSL